MGLISREFNALNMHPMQFTVDRVPHLHYGRRLRYYWFWSWPKIEHTTQRFQITHDITSEVLAKINGSWNVLIKSANIREKEIGIERERIIERAREQEKMIIIFSM